MNIWKTLPTPILALAPMEDVTDTVFRRIVASCAPPSIYFTEFTSVDGLFSRGREAVIHRFDFTPEEHPIIAQIWGNDPELFRRAAALVAELGFDGVDINMGCPEKSVLQHAAGAACMKDPKRAVEIIAATREGAGVLPVSVKTRIGYNTISESWIPLLLEQHVDALTVHGRTVKEMSKVPAHWEEIGKAVTLRNQISPDTIILGNGDVTGYADAVEKCRTFGTDGVMIGRGIFHDMWCFDRSGATNMGNHAEMISLMRKHVELFDEVWGKNKNFAVLKKFFKIYVQGFPHASELRERLMQTKTRGEVEEILDTVTF